jgi:hypothetical protein
VVEARQGLLLDNGNQTKRSRMLFLGSIQYSMLGQTRYRCYGGALSHPWRLQFPSHSVGCRQSDRCLPAPVFNSRPASLLGSVLTFLVARRTVDVATCRCISRIRAQSTMSRGGVLGGEGAQHQRGGVPTRGYGTEPQQGHKGISLITVGKGLCRYSSVASLGSEPAQ